MKKINLIIVLVFIVSLVLCKEDEKFSLIYSTSPNVGEKIKYKTTEEVDFTIPDIGYIRFVTTLNDVLEYLDLSKQEFWDIVNKHRNDEIWKRIRDEWKLRFEIS